MITVMKRDLYVTVPDSATALRLSNQRIYQYINDGRLVASARTVSGLVLLDIEAVERLRRERVARRRARGRP